MTKEALQDLIIKYINQSIEFQIPIHNREGRLFSHQPDEERLNELGVIILNKYTRFRIESEWEMTPLKSHNNQEINNTLESYLNQNNQLSEEGKKYFINVINQEDSLRDNYSFFAKTVGNFIVQKRTKKAIKFIEEEETNNLIKGFVNYSINFNRELGQDADPSVTKWYKRLEQEIENEGDLSDKSRTYFKREINKAEGLRNSFNSYLMLAALTVLEK
ncbi:hypothetical protein HN385_02055 [archaeon]|jgi:hypothetical protein|nr:hypothetical protein [archaeon]MBT3450337.1 hypothetical protein [archaeon]MBT6868888.1 hypothetical protein [archaeon]MBT7192891.1 hypothetical protein [archaeon]MBT7380857.1 hypothetical protein [archaeon]